MNRTRIWDLPLRLFHWLLAAAFLSAFGIATLTDDEDRAFALHALLGLVAVALVAMRFVWGAIGSRWARFGSLDLRPSSLLRYVRELTGPPATARNAGHNPATSWFLLVTIAHILGLGGTGFLSGRGVHAAKEVHEVLAWSMLAFAGLHVGGVVWHRLRHGESLALGMLTGYKDAEPTDAIPSVRPWSAAALLILLAAWTTILAKGYDQASGSLSLPLVAGPLQLREAGDERSTRRSPEPSSDGQRNEDDHDD